MDSAEARSVISEEGRRLLAITRSDPLRAVPTYPGWTLADLVAHTGSVHRWVAAIVESDTSERRPRQPHAERAVEPLLEWFSAGLDQLLTVLASVDPDMPVWTLLGEGTASFWARRMAHETAVHRWDAEFAVGRATPFASLFAQSGIAETLQIHVVRPLRGKPIGDGRGLLLACTDAPGAWTVRGTPDGITVETGRGTAAATVCGPASAVWLYLMGRPADGLQRSGESAVIEGFERALEGTGRPTY